MKHWARFFLGFVFGVMSVAEAAPLSCPRIDAIERTPGEYAWTTQDSAWEGYFAQPQYGQGQSSQILSFLEARWVQLTSLKEGQGLIECDYQGNVPGEVIRFVTTTGHGVTKPKSFTWSCDFVPPFPNTQCRCTGMPQQCQAN